MIKVVSYSKTKGSENFKNFLNKSFNINMLFPVINENNEEILFDGWRGKNMINWYKFTNENNIILEFYPTYYIIKKNIKNEITYTLSTPKTIEEFINDMQRFDIQLYWTNWINLNFEPKEYLHVDEIQTYWINLLEKMNKSFELLISND